MRTNDDRVYVASNFEGMMNERYEVARQLARLGMLPCGFPCRDDISAYDWALAKSQIEAAEVFVFLLGEDYGPMAPTGLSYLHREYVYAQSLSKPILSFVKRGVLDASGSDALYLTALYELIAKDDFRLWQFCDELLTYVRAAVSPFLQKSTLSSTDSALLLPLSLSLSVTAEVAALQPAGVAPNEQESLVLAGEMMDEQQDIACEMSAKVYEGGNNTLQAVNLVRQRRALFILAAEGLKRPMSEDGLRAHMEQALSPEASERLLDEHPRAHAIDDVRLSKQQFKYWLDQWQASRLVEPDLSGQRPLWSLTTMGLEWLVGMPIR